MPYWHWNTLRLVTAFIILIFCSFQVSCEQASTSPTSGTNVSGANNTDNLYYPKLIYAIKPAVIKQYESWGLKYEPANDLHDKPQIEAAVEQALSLYPPTILRQIDEITIVTRLTILGENYVHGAIVGNDIYVAYHDEIDAYQYMSLRSTLHHEVSSIILRSRVDFPKNAWLDASGGLGSYGHSPSALLLGDFDLAAYSDEDDLAMGFINIYSRVNFEEDFNVYAELLMRGDDALGHLERKYPAIALKASLIRNYYTDLGVIYPE